MEMNKELIAKAKAAKTAEELLAIAKENGEEMTEESAKAYFEMLHPQSGELSDEELDNVAGGGCHKGDGRLVVTAGHACSFWECKRCGTKRPDMYVFTRCNVCKSLCNCNNCYWCSYEKGLWLCNNPNKCKD